MPRTRHNALAALAMASLVLACGTTNGDGTGTTTNPPRGPGDPSLTVDSVWRDVVAGDTASYRARIAAGDAEAFRESVDSRGLDAPTQPDGVHAVHGAAACVVIHRDRREWEAALWWAGFTGDVAVTADLLLQLDRAPEALTVVTAALESGVRDSRLNSLREECRAIIDRSHTGD